MTREEALKEAQRRWGSNAKLKSVRGGTPGFYPRPMVYRVGVSAVYGYTFRFKEYGYGDSWEAAFADADRREKGNRHE